MRKDIQAFKGPDFHAQEKTCMHMDRHACKCLDKHAEGEMCNGACPVTEARKGMQMDTVGQTTLHVRGHKGMQRDRQECRWKDMHAEKRTDTHREDGQECSQRTR